MPRTSSRASSSTVTKTFTSALGAKKKATDDIIKGGPSNKRPKNGHHGGPWADALYQYLDHPSDADVVYVDEYIIAVKDKYPKAKRHYLVMPRDKSYKSLKDITANEEQLLARMEAVGNRLVTDNNENEPSLEYRMGFHAVPSMNHLHMHVISQDFDSECLKNKKHWNSFTTTFFIPLEEVFGALKQEGASMDFSYRENRLKDGLKCHRCGKAQANMPQLKDHIASCDCNPRRKEGTY